MDARPEAASCSKRLFRLHKSDTFISNGLGVVLERMDTVGKKGKGRVPLVAMRAVLNELLV
ncbi:MAG: hypothetical protein KJ718_06150 [Nanoarchaeota archaeon]|nr:hypothetical protein [Nanoarchaeota archaeon]MBU1052104.1 hypothetical protein [Nanoarchaeota archaeon]MBU1988630.1 hypothetical protein [Nanoarchaeota archaeon]